MSEQNMQKLQYPNMPTRLHGREVKAAYSTPYLNEEENGAKKTPQKQP